MAGHGCCWAGNFDVSTHAHSDFSTYSRVRFAARASADTELIVSITTLQAENYWEDAEAGLAWQVARVSVGTEWANYDVPLSEMAPVTACRRIVCDILLHPVLRRRPLCMPVDGWGQARRR
jgi:hypothetical protein